MKTKKDYQYKQFNVIFDASFEQEKLMIEWLENHKGPKNGYCAQLKKALKYFMEASLKWELKEDLQKQ